MEMRKLLVMVVMLFAVVSLTACGENLDALELLELSYEAQADIDSFIVEMEADISVSVPGMSVSMLMTMRTEVESEARRRLDSSMLMMGEEMSETIFLRDGYEYSEESISGMVERSRSEADAVGATEMDDIFDTRNFISENMNEDSSAESTDDGYRLTFTLNMAGMMAFLEELDLMDDIFEFDFDEDDDWDVTMIMYIDEDYLPISSELAMEVETILEGTSGTMAVDLTITTVQIDQVIIDFPDWLDEVGNLVPVSEADLIGTWELFDDDLIDFDFSLFMVFNADGTGMTVVVDSLGDEVEDFTWEVVDDQYVYMTVGGSLERFEAVIVDDMLTLIIEEFIELNLIRTDDLDLSVEVDTDEVADDDEMNVSFADLFGEWEDGVYYDDIAEFAFRLPEDWGYASYDELIEISAEMFFANGGVHMFYTLVANNVGNYIGIVVIYEEIVDDLEVEDVVNDIIEAYSNRSDVREIGDVSVETIGDHEYQAIRIYFDEFQGLADGTLTFYARRIGDFMLTMSISGPADNNVFDYFE